MSIFDGIVESVLASARFVQASSSVWTFQGVESMAIPLFVVCSPSSQVQFPFSRPDLRPLYLSEPRTRVNLSSQHPPAIVIGTTFDVMRDGVRTRVRLGLLRAIMELSILDAYKELEAPRFATFGRWGDEAEERPRTTKVSRNMPYRFIEQIWITAVASAFPFTNSSGAHTLSCQDSVTNVVSLFEQ